MIDYDLINADQKLQILSQGKALVWFGQYLDLVFRGWDTDPVLKNQKLPVITMRNAYKAIETSFSNKIYLGLFETIELNKIIQELLNQEDQNYGLIINFLVWMMLSQIPGREPNWTTGVYSDICSELRQKAPPEKKLTIVNKLQMLKNLELSYSQDDVATKILYLQILENLYPNIQTRDLILKTFLGAFNSGLTTNIPNVVDFWQTNEKAISRRNLIAFNGLNLNKPDFKLMTKTDFMVWISESVAIPSPSSNQFGGIWPFAPLCLWTQEDWNKFDLYTSNSMDITLFHHKIIDLKYFSSYRWEYSNFRIYAQPGGKYDR